MRLEHTEHASNPTHHIFAQTDAQNRLAHVGACNKVDVPPKKVPYFKPGKELKDLINREAEAEADAAAGGMPSIPGAAAV